MTYLILLSMDPVAFKPGNIRKQGQIQDDFWEEGGGVLFDKITVFMYLDRQTLAKSVDPDQAPQSI